MMCLNFLVVLLIASVYGNNQNCSNEGGSCEMIYRHYCDGIFKRNLCGMSSSYQCCIPKKSNGTCSNSVAACRVLALHNNGSIMLENKHRSDKIDEAFPILNIKDACDGKESKRSSGWCSDCPRFPSPGGSVCIDEVVLNYIEEIAKIHTATITQLTGGCSLCVSHHHRGRAVRVLKDDYFQSYADKCEELGGTVYARDLETSVDCYFPIPDAIFL